MEGHDYEYVVAAYLRNKGYHSVKVTKASGDYGVDVIAHKGQMKYAVQCKYYNSPVSLGAVQEAVAGKAMYGCNAAMVVTNSTFTKAAEELAAKNGVVLIPGVKSSGTTLKGKLKKLGVICLVIFVLFMIALTAVVTDTIISQFKSGLYKQAILNIIDLICVWGVFVGIPIGIVVLCKRLIRTAKEKAEQKKNRQIVENTIKAVPQEHKTDAVNIPEGFAKYQNLTSSKVEEYSFTPTRKSCEEMLQALSKLRKEDFDTYSHLYEVFKSCMSKNYISVSFLQRQMKIGFNRAARIMDAMEKIGFVELEYTSAGLFSGKIAVTEREVVELLTEVENNPVYIHSEREEIVSALKKLKSNDYKEFVRLYETVKTFFPEGHISASAAHIKMGYHYTEAYNVINTLKEIGMISQNSLCDYEFVISEQEIVNLFTEVEKLSNITTDI